MDKKLLSKVIERKRKSLSTFIIEQMGIAGFIGGFVGLLVGELYTIVSDNLVWQIANVFLYAFIGMVIGYFTSKRKKEDLQVELMILENFYKNQSN
ncbi:MAG: hypothetical protein E6356_10910 [Terrisporobacter othiniensis]|uniref:Uncharacterized protein n=1 Tax=Terrisporobacter hibernicus TaxID=2813371 RepID=A0AAX2ZF82_9FIRM|nr:MULTISPECIES: hypothetical protein [Terrisporobacter]MDU4861703.1 hypothetical protein [Terrisporobacter othiniensis]SFJ20187.1 hypothetical protein SAMN02910355_1511 [Terrisporobacter glycolicus]MCC3863461.1 hypothetical protein [Terrisporobacter petrolearius]MDU6995356.1 hypothetical protein [Terrisporobacter othiniensis]UEL47721.1 hypothetical protein JW646_19230 [Terrisporobacter hibernicus]